jgi:hypothetical protein
MNMQGCIAKTGGTKGLAQDLGLAEDPGSQSHGSHRHQHRHTPRPAAHVGPIFFVEYFHVSTLMLDLFFFFIIFCCSFLNF